MCYIHAHAYQWPFAGSVDVLVPAGSAQKESAKAGGGAMKSVATKGVGETFGSVALLYGTPRTASVPRLTEHLNSIDPKLCSSLKRKPN